MDEIEELKAVNRDLKMLLGFVIEKNGGRIEINREEMESANLAGRYIKVHEDFMRDILIVTLGDTNA